MNLDMNIPTKVSNPPIVEAIAEVYFENESPSAVLFGKMYAALAETFNETEALPIVEMPAEFINKQPELKYAIHYRLKNKLFSIGIGQRVVSINRVCTEVEYGGWDEYIPVIEKVIEELKKTELVTMVSKVSLKYMNLFTGEDKNLSNIFKLGIDFGGSKLEDFNDLNISFFRVINENVKLGMGISSNATLSNPDVVLSGVLLNIDAFKDTPTKLTEVSNSFVQLHRVLEVGFFESLNDKNLESMDPQYV